jgi:TM2 domain-containing membrane protein YozV
MDIEKMNIEELYSFAKDHLANVQDRKAAVGELVNPGMIQVARRFLETTEITDVVALDNARYWVAVAEARKDDVEKILSKYDGNFANLGQQVLNRLVTALAVNNQREEYARLLILHMIWINGWTDDKDFYNSYRGWLSDLYISHKKEAIFQEFVMGRIMWAFLAAYASDFESFHLQRTGVPLPLPTSRSRDLPKSSRQSQQSGGQYGQQGYAQSGTSPKSKLVAGVLGIFLGQLGIHNFYLGFKQKAIAQLVISIIGYLTIGLGIGALLVLIAGVWGLIEGIKILVGSSATDSSGNPLC